MRVITATDLQADTKMYLDLAKTEDIVIRRGESETFHLTSSANFDADEELDLARAITMDELFVLVKEDIRKMFEKRTKQ